MLLYFYNASFFGGDLLVSFGSAHQASLIDESFFQQLLNSWNLRGFGYKLIIFLNYQFISNWVNMFSQPKLFCLVYKIIHSLFILFTVFGGYFLLKDRLTVLKIKVFPLVNSILIVTFSASFLMIGQPEEYAFIFTLWMIAFGLSSHKILNYLAGGVIFILFALKVTTAAFVIFPATVYWYYKKQVNSKAIIIGSVCGVVVTAILYTSLLLPDLKDVLEASIFQNSGDFSLVLFKTFLVRYSELWIYNPFLYVGILFSLISIISITRWKSILIASCLFSVGFVIYFQNKFFPYHFVLFFPLATYSFYNLFKKIKLISLIFIIPSLFFFFQIYFHGLKDEPRYNIRGSASYNWKFNFEFRNEIAQNIKNEIGNPTETVMYLTEGGINYFLPNPSYSRYFYPLPLQRVGLNPKLKETEVYQNTLKSFLNYQGNYIVWQPDWFNLKMFPSLNEYISQNFEEVYSYKNYQQMKLLKRKSNFN